jgi:hypothetical protein
MPRRPALPEMNGTEPDPAVAAAIAERSDAQRKRLTDKVDRDKAEKEKREERFITLVQAAMELDLADCRDYDLKERNALYANCVRFLAVIGKFTEGDDDGNFFDN